MTERKEDAKRQLEYIEKSIAALKNILAEHGNSVTLCKHCYKINPATHEGLTFCCNEWTSDPRNLISYEQNLMPQWKEILAE